MDRKEFLTAIGFGTAGVFIASCLGGCEKETVPAAPSNVNTTIKLSDYTSLANVGGMIYLNGIIIAKAVSGSYIAVSQYCTHAGGQLSYNKTTDKFQCPLHGATFTEAGKVSSGPANSPLTQYTVVDNGDGTITIKS